MTLSFKRYLTEQPRSNEQAVKLGKYIAKKDTHKVLLQMDKGTAIHSDSVFKHKYDHDSIGNVEKAYTAHLKAGGNFPWRQRDPKVHKIAIADLHPTQDTTAFRHHEAMKKMDDHEPIRVIKHQGKHFVWDGHHRVVAHRLKGKTHINAHLEDFDK